MLKNFDKTLRNHSIVTHTKWPFPRLFSGSATADLYSLKGSNSDTVLTKWLQKMALPSKNSVGPPPSIYKGHNSFQSCWKIYYYSLFLLKFVPLNSWLPLDVKVTLWDVEVCGSIRLRTQKKNV